MNNRINNSVDSPWIELASHTTTQRLDFIEGWRSPVELGVSCPIHSHVTVEMVYHRRGSGITRIGKNQDETHSFSEGSCVIYAPDLPHDQVMDTTGEDICVHVSVPAKYRKKLQGCLVIDNASRIISEDWDRLSTGKKPTNHLEKGIFNLRATATLLAMLHEYCSPDTTKYSDAHMAVRQAEAYIREHFASIQSMQEVAEYAGLSHDRLRHLFREQRDISLVAFLTHVKLERAKSLLIHSNLPLKQIATLCGFQEESYFSTLFRRNTGMPPGSFRRSGSNQLPTSRDRPLR